MRESSDHDSTNPEPTTTSEHDQRNRSQYDLLRLAMERKRHADHIETLLRWARSDPASAPEPGDAPERAAESSRDPSD
jgi:hypothetical protein